MALMIGDPKEFRAKNPRRRNRRVRPDYAYEPYDDDPFSKVAAQLASASRFYKSLKDDEKATEDAIKNKDKDKKKTKEVDTLQLMVLFMSLQFPMTLAIGGLLLYMFKG